MNQQKRIILAVVLSFVFMIGWDYFFVPKNNKLQANAEQNQTITTQAITQNNATKTPNVKKIEDKQIIATIEGEHFKAKFDTQGNLVSFLLQDEKFKNEKNEAIDLVDLNSDWLPLSIRFFDEKTAELSNKTPYVANKDKVAIGESLELTQDLGESKVIKTITFNDNGSYKLDIKIQGEAKQYTITTGTRPNIIADSYTNHGGLVVFADNKNKLYNDDDVSKGDKLKSLDQKAVVAAASDRYYTSLFYDFDNPFELYVNEDEAVGNNTFFYIVKNGDFSINGYFGPKDHKALEAIDSRLTDVVEYGWFSFIARPMFLFLNFLHSHIGNWGWSIVVLTLLLRVVLYPLTYKSMVSMQKLKVLAPQIKEIQEKYKGDPQKINTHMMELYRKHKANPMGGCLPILIQIPIFFAIYRVLLNAIELKAAPWAFWITDLSLKDPYYVLPILMGGTMFLQQIISPMTIQDKTQAMIMKFLPIIFTFFFINFPAGLTLYWCVNNACSLLQQFIINKIFQNKDNSKNTKK